MNEENKKKEELKEEQLDQVTGGAQEPFSGLKPQLVREVKRARYRSNPGPDQAVMGQNAPMLGNLDNIRKEKEDTSNQ